jgi:hypothetical protein
MNTRLTQAISKITFLFLMAISSIASAFAAEPLIPTLTLTATAGACNEINLSFIPGDGNRRLIIACANAPVTEFPVDGTNYNGGSIFGTGTNLPNGNVVVYSGSGTSTTISGLDGGAQYYFACFEFNGLGINSNYLITGFPTSDAIAPGISLTALSATGDICPGGSVELQASGAVSYLWSPSGSLSSSTDPIVTATPTTSTVYTVTGIDSNGCQDSKTLSIIVNTPPNVSLGSFQSICINEGNIVLSGGAPSGGVYFGTGISNGELDPIVAGAGNSTIYYTYTDIHGCADTASRTIQIKNAPTVTLNAFNPVCIDATPVSLSGGSPAGGLYSGTAVSGNGVFNPATAGVGSFQINYVVTAQGCTDTASQSITVNPLPTVTFSNLSATCVNTSAFALSGGSPAGGVYSGVGVSSNQFTPATAGIGNTTITYTYTSAAGCISSDTSVIHVNGIPSVSFAALASVCANTGPVALTQGSPAGGTYSGTGVGGTTFFTGIAGPGVHALTYTYQDANHCSNSASQTITVNAIPAVSLGPDTTICSDGFVTLSGGTWTSYLWSNGASTSTIRVDSTGRGIGTFRFILTATNAVACANRDTIFVTIDGCSGIPQEDLSTIEIYPNPFSNQVEVKVNERFDVKVYDMEGRLVYEKKELHSSVILGDDLKKGVYLLTVTTSRGESKRLIVKQ